MAEHNAELMSLQSALRIGLRLMHDIQIHKNGHITSKATRLGMSGGRVQSLGRMAGVGMSLH